MHSAPPVRMSPRPRTPARVVPVGVLGWAVLLLAPAPPLLAQAVEDTGRLAGVLRIDTRVDAQWDELITMEAGGATEAQFIEALSMTFRQTLASADAAPSVVEGAPVTVACHVDTFYETGLIVYSLRTQVERPGADGRPVIAWIRSWVGSFTTRELHRMFTLGEQCAESFLEAWKSAN